MAIATPFSILATLPRSSNAATIQGDSERILQFICSAVVTSHDTARRAAWLDAQMEADADLSFHFAVCLYPTIGPMACLVQWPAGIPGCQSLTITLLQPSNTTIMCLSSRNSSAMIRLNFMALFTLVMVVGEWVRAQGVGSRS
jgi:hypothetical protein